MAADDIGIAKRLYTAAKIDGQHKLDIQSHSYVHYPYKIQRYCLEQTWIKLITKLSRQIT